MATRKFIDSMNMLSGILKPHSDIIVTLELWIVNARAHKHTHAQLCICDIKKKKTTGVHMQPTRQTGAIQMSCLL